MSVSELELFYQAMNAYDQQNYDKQQSATSNKCQHTHTVSEDGILVCADCCVEIDQLATCDKEWRFRGGRNADPSRTQIRKDGEKSIRGDVEHLHFSEKMISAADVIFTEATDGGTRRGDSRISIVLGSLYFAHKIAGIPLTYKRLSNLLSVEKKDAMSGIAYILDNSPKTSAVHWIANTPQHIVDETMNKFNATRAQKQEVTALFESVENASSYLKRSRAGSVAAAVVYHWIKSHPKMKITLQEFSKRVKYSGVTISRLAKEIDSVLKKRNMQHTPSPSCRK